MFWDSVNSCLLSVYLAKKHDESKRSNNRRQHQISTIFVMSLFIPAYSFLWLEALHPLAHHHSSSCFANHYKHPLLVQQQSLYVLPMEDGWGFVRGAYGFDGTFWCSRWNVVILAAVCNCWGDQKQQVVKPWFHLVLFLADPNPPNLSINYPNLLLTIRWSIFLLISKRN